jgi:hypothetical protein
MTFETNTAKTPKTRCVNVSLGAAGRFRRVREPVSFGVPFAEGAVTHAAELSVVDESGMVIPCQATPLATWPDGSLRWVLIDFLVTKNESASMAVTVTADGAGSAVSANTGLTLQKRGNGYRVLTGTTEFLIDGAVLRAFAEARFSGFGTPFVPGSEVIVRDSEGNSYTSRIQQLSVEASGPVRITLRAQGAFTSGRRTPFCVFDARLSFYAGTGLMRFDLTLRNPRAARHPGGLWDLGDPGSILLRELCVGVRAASAEPTRVVWRADPEDEPRSCDSGELEIYQDSSGGENWKSRNHVNRHGDVPCTLRGARITDGTRSETVDRPSPIVSLVGSNGRISACTPNFWQQFPKCLEASREGLRVGLFPAQSGDAVELQGGEQKTHTVYLLVEAGGAEEAPTDSLRWVHSPLVPRLPPSHFRDTRAFEHFVPTSEDPHSDYVALMQGVVDGRESFFNKREVIDEYGWRNFGDVYADHENAYFDGDPPVISHYNNQYDVIQGLLLHFARTGDAPWFELASDLARHVIDIDLYHTEHDRANYNGGGFWHTDHYVDAARATHRSYSCDCPKSKDSSYGGGPANEHNYTTGLLYYYYLTGQSAARDSVLGLAARVLAMDDGELPILGALDRGPTGCASATFEAGYHGPGRGAGYSVNALLDAFRLCAERRYLQKSEELIRRVIHPRDDQDAMHLRDPESRWSYTVFLQVLGKYLDVKVELGEEDESFKYARASVLGYADWMLKNETPFRERFDEVEYPTETWPAHDIRKSCVFDYAAKYGPREAREAFTKKAAFFFAEAIEGVSSFDSRSCTRPMAILLANGVQRGASRLDLPQRDWGAVKAESYGEPSRFVPQKERVKRMLKTPAGLVRLALAVLRPSVLKRLVTGRLH